MADETMSASEKKKEDWMNAKWRPMMGWMYMATCTADFILFPVLWSLLQAVLHTQQMTQWQPLTLQGAGLFHIAMGAVLGIAAMGRTQEKLAGANNGGAGTTPAPSFGSGLSTTPATVPSSFGSTPSTPAPSGFGGGFGSTPAPAATPDPVAPDVPVAATSRPKPKPTL